jgi:hypothetical protein
MPPFSPGPPDGAWTCEEPQLLLHRIAHAGSQHRLPSQRVHAAGISTHAIIVHGVVAFSSGSVSGTGFANPSLPARKCPLNGPYSGGNSW